MVSRVNTVIIGAGPSGLCAAKTILQCQPEAEIQILDAQSSIGGVWAKEQLYPSLRTNNLAPALDFSDFPSSSFSGIERGKPITGDAYHTYLVAYARRWSLLDRIQLQSKVIEVRRLEDDTGWQLQVRKSSSEDIHILRCDRLVVATGSTCAPHRPTLSGTADFQGPILHSSEMGSNAEKLVGDPQIRKIAVLGGGKSAYDAVYLAACAGKQVEWIIRRSGKGPAWIFPAFTYLGPFKAWREMLTTRRIVSFMSPCIWKDGFERIRRLLHFTKYGKKLVQKFWMLIHAVTLDECGYAKEHKLKPLEPQTSVFWYGTVSGVNSYEIDLYSFIRSGQVQIYREDIARLEDHKIVLSDGCSTTLDADALITATGFSAKPTITFTPSARPLCSQSDLGIPSAGLRASERMLWQDLDEKSDVSIGLQFPRLLIGPHRGPASSTPVPYNPGSSSEFEAKYTPWRLYRGIAPPGLTMRNDHSLVFIGMFSNLANTIRLEIQCLWAYAYLFGRITQLESDVKNDQIFAETSLMQRYTQFRAPFGHGRFYPDLVFDQVPYWDMLLQDLQLETLRKRRSSRWFGGIFGWFREIFEPYTQRDYRGIVDEWTKLNSKT